MTSRKLGTHSAPNLSRRDFLVRSGRFATAAVTLGGLEACTALGGSSEAIVESTSGRLRGVRQRGAFAFRGVPYAATTEGANRFRPPVRTRSWAGVRDASMGGASAPQSLYKGPPEFNWYWSGVEEQSEDCLSLCIYTPALRDNGSRPVMVWLHGGAFSIGSGTASGFDGSYLAAAQNVVVVSVNHRLNVLGGLFLGEHEEQLSPESGNLATLDQLAALEWIKENAEAFGGDPNNITLFGQSGGAAKVVALLGHPRARGYVHRAIVQSSSGGWKLARPESAARAGHALLAELNLTAANAGKLRDVPLKHILKAYDNVCASAGGVSEFRPTLDGRVFKADLLGSDSFGINLDVPILIGNVAQEASYQLASDQRNFCLSAVQVQRRIMRQFDLDDLAAARLIEAYQDEGPSLSPSEILIRVMSDYNYRLPTLVIADHKAALGGAPVFSYQFTWRSPARGGVLGTPHTAEVPFVFGTLDEARLLVLGSADQFDVRDRMGAIWAEFARSGRPAVGLLEGGWNAYDVALRTTASLGKSWQTQTDPVTIAREAFRDIPMFEYSVPLTFTSD